MRLFVTTLVGFLALGSESASAQWLYEGNESAFGDDALHVAVTASGFYGFGLRCRGDTIEVIYMTPDTSFNNEYYKLANITQPKLRIRVDDGAIVDVDATLVDIEGKATAIGNVDIALLHSVSNAKKRVAVVLQLIGVNYHEKSFNPRGSSKALGKIMSACGLE